MTVRCMSCNRPLTDPESIARRIGKTCLDRLRPPLPKQRKRPEPTFAAVEQDREADPRQMALEWATC